MAKTFPSATIVRKLHFICMVYALASSRYLVASCFRLPLSCGRLTLKHQHQCRRCRSLHDSSSTRLTFASATSTSRRATLQSNRNMSPRNGMSSLSMSAVEEEISPPTFASLEASSGAPTNEESTMVAKRVSATQSSLNQCGERLRAGDLVSFPTETVYGLGCHALDPVAVQKVFDAKERPLSDPLIVHVTQSEDALELWAASSSMSSANNDGDNTSNTQQPSQEIEKQALSVLTKSFFPGPLTLVARAHPSIPQILMANTGYVACRSPSHSVARALIDAAQCPIAAPSANKFGHVSPTLADHVLDDLGLEDVWVVDPGLGVIDNKSSGSSSSSSVPQDDTVESTVCQVGVESTVAKIEMNTNTSGDEVIVGSINILRHGAISSQSIRLALQRANLSQYFTVADFVKFASEKVHNVAPGQTVKHYSPNVPCFMISSSRQHQQQSGDIGGEQITEEERTILSQSVIIDYGKRLANYQAHALAYRDLSSEGNPSYAASHLFETLRWSETVQGAIRVFVPEIILNDEEGKEGALVLAVKDKLTRAASAVIVKSFE